jgi:hypothetical protein
MAHSKSAARKLATQAEWTLLEASYPPLLKEITPARLKQKVARARKLQDKYRDRARQQRGEQRGKRTPKATRAAAGNAGTLAKQELFAEALARFEAQLAKLEEKAAKEAAKAAARQQKASVPKRSARPAGATTGTAPRARKSTSATTALKAVSKSSRGARKTAVFERTSSRTHQAHVGARGRRRQARRDSR